MLIFKKLARIVSNLLEDKKLSNIDNGDLNDIFFENLLEILKMAFDINLDINKLKAFKDEESSLPDYMRLGEFITKTLETKVTYIVLNHYMYLFIQAYLDSIKKDNLQIINQMMLKNGLSENEVLKVKKDYWDFVKAKDNQLLTPLVAVKS